MSPTQAILYKGRRGSGEVRMMEKDQSVCQSVCRETCVDVKFGSLTFTQHRKKDKGNKKRRCKSNKKIKQQCKQERRCGVVEPKDPHIDPHPHTDTLQTKNLAGSRTSQRQCLLAIQGICRFKNATEAKMGWKRESLREMKSQVVQSSCCAIVVYENSALCLKHLCCSNAVVASTFNPFVIH